MGKYAGDWQDADFELMARWFGIDDERLAEEFAPTLKALHEEYVATVWDRMEDCARKIAGKRAEEIPAFDFLGELVECYPVTTNEELRAGFGPEHDGEGVAK